MNNIIENLNITQSDIWTIIIAISAVFSVLFTALMWIITFKSVKQTKELFFASNRPWLYIEIFHPHFLPKQIFQPLLDITNEGKAPAQNVSLELQVKIDNVSDPIPNREEPKNIH